MTFKKLLITVAIAQGLSLQVQAANIGVTMTSFDNPFLTILLNGMKSKADSDDSVNLQLEDAKLDIGRQLDQVQSFIASGVDAIIVNAVDGDSTLSITELANEAKIPLVYVNHPPIDIDKLPDTATFVGSNELDSGTLQAQEVCKLLNGKGKGKGKGKAVIMMGPLANHAAHTRTQDIIDVFKTDDCKGISIVEKQVANWSRTDAQNLMTNWLTAGVKFDAVLANNDEMAIGAIQALKDGSVDMADVVVAGIDATPDGLAAMKANDLDVTVFQNATKQGAVAVEKALDFINGRPVERNIWVPFELVTPANFTEYNKP